MIGENDAKRAQLKGYLFEVLILELLRKNGFDVVDADNEPNNRIREKRKGFIEFRGRGSWHQIDCPCDYVYQLPFTYPLRLLGEVKFHKNAISKAYIREYIGILKDINENYYSDDGNDISNYYQRRMEFGVFFSANGFQVEAEKLAYAHGIKTISYKNNHIVNKLKNLLEILEENYLSVELLSNGRWNSFQEDFLYAIRYGVSDYQPFSFLVDYPGYIELIGNIFTSLNNIKTSIIASTATGVFLHLISEFEFPIDMFVETDSRECEVYYDRQRKVFWLQISGDIQERQFYFTPPTGLKEAALYGTINVKNEKERVFKELRFSIEVNGMLRNLSLRINRDWLNLF